MGVHHFQLTGLLHDFTTLRETPMRRDPFRDELPSPVVDLVENYRLHTQNAETHVLRAIQTVETIGRFPASAFLTDPTIDPNTQLTEPPFHPILPPGRGLAPGQRLIVSNHLLYGFPPTSNAEKIACK